MGGILLIAVIVVRCRSRLARVFLLPLDPPLLSLALRLQELMLDLLGDRTKRVQGERLQDLKDRRDLVARSLGLLLFDLVDGLTIRSTASEVVRIGIVVALDRVVDFKLDVVSVAFDC